MNLGLVLCSDWNLTGLELYLMGLERTKLAVKPVDHVTHEMCFGGIGQINSL